MGPGKTSLAGRLHKPLRVLGGGRGGGSGQVPHTCPSLRRCSPPLRAGVTGLLLHQGQGLASPEVQGLGPPHQPPCSSSGQMPSPEAGWLLPPKPQGPVPSAAPNFPQKTGKLLAAEGPRQLQASPRAPPQEGWPGLALFQGLPISNV